MTKLLPFNSLKKSRPSVLLGLALDDSRFEGVVVRRTNGSLQVEQSFGATLSLAVLTSDPALVGREIRNHLEAAGIRERHCVVCLPLNWALTVHSKLPDLPEADVASFLQIEAERGFPCAVDTLQIASSRYRSSSGEQHALQVGIPRNHLGVIEQVLRAAQLKPVGFSLGITTLQPADAPASNGVLALALSEGHVGLQISCGGGVAALRTLEGSAETEGGSRQPASDLVAREIRITLGQLSGDLRDSIRRIRVFGPRDAGQKLAADLRARFAPAGIQVDAVTAYAVGELGAHLPPNTVVTAALSLAARHLTGRGAILELMPPRVTAWRQFATRYASRKLGVVGASVGAIALLVVGAFLVQQWQLSHYRSQWAAMSAKVHEIEDWQQQIRRYRPWFDDSLRTLSILRRLTEAFPEDGAVASKTVEIRDPGRVSCSGTARDNPALLRTLDQLRLAREIAEIKVEQMRGRSPLQFTFDFHWREGVRNEN